MRHIAKNLAASFLPPLLLMLHCFVLHAAEVPTLEDITFQAASQNEEQVIFRLNGTYIPKIFAIKGKKPRVVFDFPDTVTAGSLKNVINTNGKFIKRIRIGIHEGKAPKTRVVLDLRREKNIHFNQNFDQKNNTLTVTVYFTDTSPTSSVVKEKTALATSPAEKKASKPPVTEKKPDNPTALPPTPPPPVAKKKEAPTTQTKKLSPSRPIAAVDAQKQPQPEKKSGPPADKPVSIAKKSSPALPPILSSVVFDGSSKRGEMIQFSLNEFHPPTVFGIEEGLPRVVCDFKDTRLGSNVRKMIKTNGRYVRSIRIGRHKNPDKVRVVIDLEPNNNYDLQQVFFKEDNLFVIIVNIMHNTPPVTELEKPL